MSTKQRNQYQPSFQVIQDSKSQMREGVAQEMRGAALTLIRDLFFEEIEQLCGPRFSKKGGRRLPSGRI